MLQKYSPGSSRYYGSGEIMYKTEDLYNNHVLRPGHGILDASAMLLFDKLRGHLSFDVSIESGAGSLLQVYWEFGKLPENMVSFFANEYMNLVRFFSRRRRTKKF